MRALFASLLVILTIVFSCCQTCFADSTLEVFDFAAKSLTVDPANLKSIINGMTVEDLRDLHLDVRELFNPRILGGYPADIKDSPWEVALVFGMYPDPARAQFCGGSVISDDWAVTAAHCVLGLGVNSDPRRVDLSC